jgi:hypothetical protein
VLLIGLLVGMGWVLSSKTLKVALPFESLVTGLVVGAICVTLFHTGRLG